jgi:hypothetical protein
VGIFQTYCPNHFQQAGNKQDYPGHISSEKLGPSPVKDAFAGRPAKRRVEKPFLPGRQQISTFFFFWPESPN